MEEIFKPEITQMLVESYRAFQKEISDPESVFYPCCGIDASPSQVFRNVTYLDLDKNCIDVLRKEGLNAIQGDIKNYSPKEMHDLLLLMNPTHAGLSALPHVINGGFIIANNYHGTASWLSEHSNDYQLVASIVSHISPKSKPGANLSKDITDLFVPVADFAELKKLRPDCHDFIAKSYPHLLRMANLSPGRTIEESYFIYHKELFEETDIKLPSKRVADYYVFLKR